MYKKLRLLMPGLLLLSAAGCIEMSKQEAKTSAKENGMSLGTLGAVEYVHVDPFEKPFEARVDTGATSSSIGAYDIKPFERDGKRWVTFKIKQRVTNIIKSYEMPLVKKVIIKSKEEKLFKNKNTKERRYVVKMRFKIGNQELIKNFSLANRDRFEYQVLIGRNVIYGNAVVDVSKKHLQPTK